MAKHYPVMLSEVLEYLAPRDGGVYVDGTFGAGGYSRAILEVADCRVIAIDRDPSAQETAKRFKSEFGARFTFLSGCFGNVKALLHDDQITKVDGLVLDLGVSSMQLDQADRGFSFKQDGPLDMRMEQEGRSAADLVNSLPAEELANIIYKYGEERASRKIAKKIAGQRGEKPFETTAELADLVRSVVHVSPKDKTDPATRTFQALRIAVNDELGELEQFLDVAPLLLHQKGRVVVVSFHSLEDRLVKDDFQSKAGKKDGVSRHLPPLMSALSQDCHPLNSQQRIIRGSSRNNNQIPAQGGDDVSAPFYKILTKKPVLPSSNELSENLRSRSAKLRAVQMIGASV